eukprot:TRINITY_DN5329_c0_g1_i2.p1 TRINITY_DN5329_c0_g1~~TRINITY_DN5329_c0_g1_i2.p1  ORF type:complete len:240 (-),score=68.38 TRINITY_DN5329_c0_g1_i2:53-733(-)
MTTTSVKGTVGTLNLTIIRAKDLAIGDITGTSDPYCVAVLGDQEAKTETIPKTCDPEWNFNVTFPVSDPLAVLRIVIFDADTMKKDDFLGEISLNVADFQNGDVAHKRYKVGTSKYYSSTAIVPQGTIELKVQYTIDNKLGFYSSLFSSSNEEGLEESKLEGEKKVSDRTFHFHELAAVLAQLQAAVSPIKEGKNYLDEVFVYQHPIRSLFFMGVTLYGLSMGRRD